MTKFVSPTTLIEWLLDGQELAVLDAREQGVYFDSHLFHAACIPLSSLEMTPIPPLFVKNSPALNYS